MPDIVRNNLLSHKPNVLAKAILAVALVSLCMVIVLQILYSRDLEWRRQLAQLDDSAEFLVDFASLLGPEWESSNVGHFMDDLSGWEPSSIIGSSVLSTYVRESGVAIVHRVITYFDTQRARERYLLQEECVFEHDFCESPRLEVWSDNVSFTTDTNPNAEASRAACQFTPQDTGLTNRRCGALFLYGNHIVFLDVLMMRNSVQYLSMSDLEALFRAVDWKMSNALSE